MEILIRTEIKCKTEKIAYDRVRRAPVITRPVKRIKYQKPVAGLLTENFVGLFQKAGINLGIRGYRTDRFPP